MGRVGKAQHWGPLELFKISYVASSYRLSNCLENNKAKGTRNLILEIGIPFVLHHCTIALRWPPIRWQWEWNSSLRISPVLENQAGQGLNINKEWLSKAWLVVPKVTNLSVFPHRGYASIITYMHIEHGYRKLRGIALPICSCVVYIGHGTRRISRGRQFLQF